MFVQYNFIKNRGIFNKVNKIKTHAILLVIINAGHTKNKSRTQFGCYDF